MPQPMISLLKAKRTSCNEYLAVLFLRKSDPKRYGNLVVEVQNAMTRGSDEYPKNIPTAYDYLMEYKPYKSMSPVDPNETGITYLSQSGRGNTDRSGRGRGGRGRATSRGQGRGSRNPSLTISTLLDDQDSTNLAEDNQDPDENAEEDEVVNNINNEFANYSSVMNAETYLQGTSTQEKSSILLLDSCSTADIISNPRLLHDITPCEVQLPVKTLAGTIHLNMQGKLGQYPNPV